MYRYGEARATGKPLFFPATKPDGALYGAFEDMGDIHIIGMVCGRVRYTPRRAPDHAPKYPGEARLIGRSENPYRSGGDGGRGGFHRGSAALSVPPARLVARGLRQLDSGGNGRA